MNDILKDLRPAKLPYEPSFWPPTWQFALAIFLALILISLLAYLFVRTLPKRKAKKQALIEINNIFLKDDRQIINGISDILRRLIKLKKSEEFILHKDFSEVIRALQTSSNDKEINYLSTIITKNQFHKNIIIEDKNKLKILTIKVIKSCHL